MELSVIIPAFNESLRLPRTLQAIRQYLANRALQSEIIVVDDGSTDQTADVVRTFPEVRLISHPQNLGKGAAVRTGMMAARGAWRLLSDADLSTPIEDIEQLQAAGPADILIGSRRAPGAHVEQSQSWWKVWLGRMGNVLIQLLLVPGIRDTRCGFKLFSAKTTFLFQLQRLNRWGFDDEILFLAKRYKLRVKEVPVRWVNNVQTKVQPKDYLRSLIEIVQIHINHIRGLYRLRP